LLPEVATEDANVYAIKEKTQIIVVIAPDLIQRDVSRIYFCELVS